MATLVPTIPSDDKTLMHKLSNGICIVVGLGIFWKWLPNVLPVLSIFWIEYGYCLFLYSTIWLTSSYFNWQRQRKTSMFF